MAEKSPTSTRSYERPIIRTIGEREMFEVAGRPSSEQSYGQAANWSGGANAQGWCWPDAAGQYWHWGAWPPASEEAAMPEEEMTDAGLRTPLCRTVEEDDGFLVYIELPGADPDDIDLYVGHSDIVVTTASPEEKAAPDGPAESYYGTLEFGEELDADRTEIGYSNGVLHLKLFKSKSGSRRHLKVSPAR
jgi:HSP20 family molecular chaperone IbpA